ncbi:acyl-CoA thioester hydrolase [Parelusimicrobium proximum]|uniref:acyl-CoA thioesterase n=1 Tax=Parelusimicrobium proximum TaxID=3228953 RepID=UPI003D186311
MKKRIFYHDTDCGGVVYYGNYLKFFEEARTLYIENLGASLRSLMEQGVLFVVARQEVEYKYPCMYGDELTIETKVLELSAIKIVFENTITNQNGRLSTKGKTTLVCVDKTGTPRTIPEELKSKIAVG